MSEINQRIQSKIEKKTEKRSSIDCSLLINAKFLKSRQKKIKKVCQRAKTMTKPTPQINPHSFFLEFVKKNQQNPFRVEQKNLKRFWILFKMELFTLKFFGFCFHYTNNNLAINTSWKVGISFKWKFLKYQAFICTCKSILKDCAFNFLFLAQ